MTAFLDGGASRARQAFRLATVVVYGCGSAPDLDRLSLDIERSYLLVGLLHHV